MWVKRHLSQANKMGWLLTPSKFKLKSWIKFKTCSWTQSQTVKDFYSYAQNSSRWRTLSKPYNHPLYTKVSIIPKSNAPNSGFKLVFQLWSSFTPGQSEDPTSSSRPVIKLLGTWKSGVTPKRLYLIHLIQSETNGNARILSYHILIKIQQR